MWLGSRREYPPPYQHQNTPIHGLESPRGHKEWRRRSFPKRSMRRHSERGDHGAQHVPKREPALPSPVSSRSRDGIEQEWCKIRQAQEQVRKDRQTLERDKAAHEAKVRYELEQLGRDIEDERRRLRQRGNDGGGGGYDGFLPHSPPSEEAIADHEEEEVYHDSWFGEYDYPRHDGYWGMNGGPDTPDYEDEEDGDEERSFAGWESDDDEPEAFAQSAYRSYFQSPPRYADFDESHQAWEDEVPTYREQPRYSDQKCEDIKKAYDAYIGK